MVFLCNPTRFFGNLGLVVGDYKLHRKKIVMLSSHEMRVKWEGCVSLPVQTHVFLSFTLEANEQTSTYLVLSGLDYTLSDEINFDPYRYNITVILREIQLGLHRQSTRWLIVNKVNAP